MKKILRRKEEKDVKKVDWHVDIEKKEVNAVLEGKKYKEEIRIL